MSPNGAMVRFRDVSYETGGKRILCNASFELNSGETLALLGRSGAGKTTALKAINRLVVPTSGVVEVEGRATTEWDPIRLRRRAGYVIQEVGLMPHFTVAQNVGLVPDLEGWSRAKTDARVRELLEAVGLPANEYASRYPRQLSGGQRQRVGIARALAADPPLLLLDEPFGALDPITRLDLQRQFVTLRDRFRKTAVFVTHDIREAFAVATRIALLHDGRMEAMGTRDEFLRVQNSEAKAFLACLDWKLDT
jgi:osmoprotectant transport system ATP-binding protein